MSQVAIIIKNEYLTDIRAKSFWISTILGPIVLIAFGGIVGYLAADSDIMKTSANPAMPEMDNLTGAQVFGMLTGIFLTFFIMIYGAMIFNKVKTEKCNRIMEIISTCVPGRTMMLAKICAVGLVGITQLLLWAVIIFVLVSGIVVIAAPAIPWHELFTWQVFSGLLWGAAFFLGGYVFFGALYAAIGAMTDKNNENQEYMTLLTFILLGSFYLGEFVVTHPGEALTLVASFIPFTAPTIGAVGAVSDGTPLWISLLSLLTLYGFAALTLVVAGKIYSGTLLLRGKKFSPKDLIVLLRTK